MHFNLLMCFFTELMCVAQVKKWSSKTINHELKTNSLKKFLMFNMYTYLKK